MSAFWPAGAVGILVQTGEKKGEGIGFRTQKMKPPHFSSPLINSLVYLPVTMTNDATS